MRRSRLRTKEGCLTCKNRRKKCDQARPLCRECERLRLKCRWTTLDKDDDNTDSLASPYNAISDISCSWLRISRAPRMKAVIDDPHSLAGQMQFALIDMWPGLYRTSLAAYIQSEPFELSTTMYLAICQRTARSAMAAFTAYLLYSSTGRAALNQACLLHYQMAVRCLQRTLSTNAKIDTEGVLGQQLASCILGMLESSGFGNAPLAAQHFCASARLLQPCLAHYSSRSAVVAMLWDNCESTLFHLNSMSAFLNREQLSRVFASLDWHAFQSLLRKHTAASQRSCYESTHNGVPYEVFVLALQMTHAARIWPSSEHSARQSGGWWRKIEELDSLQRTYYTGISPDSRKHGTLIHQLYLCALSIYATKIEKPKICSALPLIQELVTSARFAIDDLHRTSGVSSLVYWPLTIVLAACHDQVTFSSLLLQSQTFAFNGGFRKYWDVFAARVQEARLNDQCCADTGACTGSHDGLNVLLSADGVSGRSESTSAKSTSLIECSRDTWFWRV